MDILLDRNESRNQLRPRGMSDQEYAEMKIDSPPIAGFVRIATNKTADGCPVGCRGGKGGVYRDRFAIRILTAFGFY
jgi:hypothetical protein